MEKTIERVLLTLARAHLNEAGIEEVKEQLLVRELGNAKLMILGAVDRRFGENKINGKEASEAYRSLGVPPKEMFRVRNKSASLSK